MVFFLLGFLPGLSAVLPLSMRAIENSRHHVAFGISVHIFHVSFCQHLTIVTPVRMIANTSKLVTHGYYSRFLKTRKLSNEQIPLHFHRPGSYQGLRQCRCATGSDNFLITCTRSSMKSEK